MYKRKNKDGFIISPFNWRLWNAKDCCEPLMDVFFLLFYFNLSVYVKVTVNNCLCKGAVTCHNQLKGVFVEPCAH